MFQGSLTIAYGDTKAVRINPGTTPDAGKRLKAA